ncbi:LysR family transcriptional regulator [Fusobacterium sp. PH5-44]|uniref:LysR family transcriptional regulator n=1 Tax=unclassified Fusobacterium TaxID=2648384 RepID=UPI003D19C372
MNFTNLNYFVVLAEELNFTRAARKSYISQQSLSNHISKLEKYYKVKLFDRNSPMTLTPAGKILYKHAKSIFSLKSQISEEMEYIRNDIRGEITVGTTVSRGNIILPLILRDYHKKFPYIKVNIYQQSTSKKLEEALYKGIVDVIIGFTPLDSQTFSSEFFCKEEYVVVVPVKILKDIFGNNFEKYFKQLKSTKDISILKNCPFIKMDSSTHAGIIFDKIFKERKIIPNILYEVYNIETMIYLAYEELGAIICPKIFIDNPLESHKIKDLDKMLVFPIKYFNDEITISITYLKNKPISTILYDFIEISKNSANNSGLNA